MTAPRPSSLPQAVFMLGVGGMGMAPLAIYLAQAGVAVSGWDDGLRPEVARLLESHGVTLQDKVPEAPLLVARSSAIGEQHELYRESVERGARALRRGELLAEVLAGKKLVAVVGSHGKTTTTGLLIHFLRETNFDCGYLLGGLFRDNTSPAHFAAQSDWVVAEVDESDGTVEHFSPEITVAVNFDWDHADRYQSEADLRAAFQRLFQRTNGRVIVPEACATLPNLLASDQSIPCAVTGGFNESNAAMAMAAAREMGAQVQSASLKDFPGIQRRQDCLGQFEGVTLLADYAHHPTEIEALLKHASSEWPGRQIAIFQPHRFTRTRQFAKAFADALKTADEVMLLPVYAASEKPLADGQSSKIVEASGGDWPVLQLSDLNHRLDQMLTMPSPATVLFLGAGDIDAAARSFVQDWQLATAWRKKLSSETKLMLGQPLANKTTLRVGGNARFYAEPANINDLRQLLSLTRESGLPWFALGRGSNLIVCDEGFPGLVINLHHEGFRSFEMLDDGRVWVGAGLALKRLCGLAAKENLSGFEFLEGIPGTVGGALRMNAGAMGGWIFDVVESVQFMTREGDVREMRREDFHVGYRRCEELVDSFALSAVLRSGSQSESTAIREQMDTYAGKRKESQPREPSAGCIFKNPDGNHAGKLIDEVGLKGRRIGGAQVSTVHANFIINTGEATAADVLELIRHIRATVQRERGIELEPEALLVGQAWEAVL